MAVGNLRVSSRTCSTCQTTRKFEKNALVWGCGDLIMILVTFGVWLLLKFGFDLASNPWRCSVCGTRA